jgi:hypothetical protein
MNIIKRFPVVLGHSSSRRLHGIQGSDDPF